MEVFSASLKELNATAKIGISAQDIISQKIELLGFDPGRVQGMSDLAREVKSTADLALELGSTGKAIIKVKADFRKEIQGALRQIDNTNRVVDEYAEIHVLRSAYQDWVNALGTLANSGSILERAPRFRSEYQNDVARALTRDDRDKLMQMIDQISPSVQRAASGLRKAELAESTATGRIRRGLGRFIRDTSQKAGKSRMGREVGLAFKTLVLGTKAYYDLMELGPNEDLMSWAMSYEQDIDQLSRESEEIRQMDGWSLTGKNTFAESGVNNAYEKSFRNE